MGPEIFSRMVLEKVEIDSSGADEGGRGLSLYRISSWLFLREID